MVVVKNYLSLVKFSHTVFAMPFAVIGFFLGMISRSSCYDDSARSLPILFVLVILCMVTARSAAMAFNRWADRKFDRENPRTKSREIPSGIISEKNALIFVAVNSFLFITVTFFINRICFYLSPIALGIVLGYSYTKRFTPLCHLVLGLGLSLAPIGAYLAVTGKFGLLPVLYSFAVLCWVSGFDIIYALQDEAFDRSWNLRSIPASMGKKNALLFSRMLHVFSALLVTYAGYSAGLHVWYWTGTALYVGLLIYQQLLVTPDDLSRVNLAFFTTNGLASILFAVFFLFDLFM